MSEPSPPVKPAPQPRRGRREKPARPQPRRPPFLWRLVVAIVEGVGALVGLVLLAVILLAVRMEWGPLEVDWLTPAMTGLLDDEAAPLSVTMARTSVSWARGSEIDLIAGDLRVSDPVAGQVLALPSLAVSLSLKSLLLNWQLAPTRVTLIAPQLRIVRAKDGQMAVAVGAAQSVEGAEVPSQPLPDLLRSLSGTQRPDEPLGMLSQLAVIRAELVFDDRQQGVAWRLTDGEIRLTRRPTGFDATVAGRLGSGAASARADATLGYDTSSDTLHYRTSLAGLDLSTLGPALPAGLGGAAALKLPMAVTLSGVLAVDTMQPGPIALELKGGPGAVVDPHFAAGELAIRSVELAGGFDPARHRLDLDRLAVDLGGPAIQLKGSVADLDPAALAAHIRGAPAKLTGSVQLRALPLDRFAAVWPTGVADDARTWITNHLTVGTLESASAQATATFDPGAVPPLAVHSYTGSLAVKGATVAYLTGVAKVEAVDGTGTLGPDRLQFELTGGRLRDLSVPHGTVVIDQLDAPWERMTIDLELRGPASDVLTVLNAKRLQYATAIGLDPAEVEGSLDGTLHFRFPLKKDLPIADVDYGAEAGITGLKVAHAAFGQDLTDGAFRLSLDQHAVTLDGTGRLDAVPAKVTWMQRLSGTAPPKSRVHVEARLDDRERQRLDLDPLPEIVHGPVDVVLGYDVADDHHASAQVALDLADTALGVEALGWSKPAASPATASFSLDLLDGHVDRLDHLAVAAGDLVLKGGLVLHDGRLVHGDFDQVRLGETVATATVDHPGDGPWQLMLRGPVIDLQPVIKHLNASRGKPDTTPGPALALTLAGDRVILGTDRELAAVALTAAIARHAIASGGLTAQLGSSGKLTARLDRVEDGGRFILATDDFGALFHLAGLGQDLVGGSLAVTGSSVAEGDGRRFTGAIDGKDYRVLHMPFMARLLSLASFETVGSLLNGNGIPFTTLKADFSLKQGRLEVRHGRAYGGAIGMNADGWFDLKASTLSLEGTLVPAYTLNSILGGVPLLGDLLLGGKGQGVFGANVRVSGSLAEPTISVNPLSALAPGFVRNLFLFDAPGPDSTPPPAR